MGRENHVSKLMRSRSIRIRSNDISIMQVVAAQKNYGWLFVVLGSQACEPSHQFGKSSRWLAPTWLVAVKVS